MIKHGYESKLHASRWEEGMLCGNGTIGALVMGGGPNEKVLFSHENLYAPLHPKRLPVHTAKTLGTIRELLAKGEYQEAANFVVRQGKEEGFEHEMYWDDSFMSACTLAVDMKGGQETEYKKSLDFETGVSTTEFLLDGVSVKREVFVSRASGFAVMRITSSAPLDYEVQLRELEETDQPNEWWEVGYTRNYAPAVICAQGDTISYEGSFTTTDYGYRCAAKVAKTDGKMVSGQNGISVSGATETLIFVNVIVCEDVKQSGESAAGAVCGVGAADCAAAWRRSVSIRRFSSPSGTGMSCCGVTASSARRAERSASAHAGHSAACASIRRRRATGSSPASSSSSCSRKRRQSIFFSVFMVFGFCRFYISFFSRSMP